MQIQFISISETKVSMCEEAIEEEDNSCYLQEKPELVLKPTLQLNIKSVSLKCTLKTDKKKKKKDKYWKNEKRKKNEKCPGGPAALQIVQRSHLARSERSQLVRWECFHPGRSECQQQQYIHLFLHLFKISRNKSVNHFNANKLSKTTAT